MKVPSSNLRSTVLSLLSNRYHRTAQELLNEAASHYRRVSIQAIYKILRSLQAEGIVVKVQDSYSLNLSWVLNQLNYFENLSQFLTSPRACEQLVPIAGEKKRWHYGDLRRADDFWVQMMTLLMRQAPEALLFQWMPHPWFELVHHKKDEVFQEAVRASSGLIYTIIGGDTPLDREYTRDWPGDIYHYSHASSDFHGRDAEYINVIEPYVLTVRLQKQVVQELDSLFSTASSIASLRAEQVFAIFNKQTRVSVTLENSSTRARRLANRFQQYWG